MTEETSKKDTKKDTSPAEWGTHDTTLRESFTNTEEKEATPVDWGKKDPKLRDSYRDG